MDAVAKLENITDAETAVLLGIFKDAVPLKWPAGRALEALVIAALAEDPMTPPTITKQMGATRVTFSANDGLHALCLALGPDSAARIRAAAGLPE